MSYLSRYSNIKTQLTTNPNQSATSVLIPLFVILLTGSKLLRHALTFLLEFISLSTRCATARNCEVNPKIVSKCQKKKKQEEKKVRKNPDCNFPWPHALQGWKLLEWLRQPVVFCL